MLFSYNGFQVHVNEHDHGFFQAEHTPGSPSTSVNQHHN